MRTLFIFRHAKSDRTGQVANDFDRPLNQRGHQDALKMGLWMKQHRLQPNWVLCSPAARTWGTLVLLREYVVLADDVIEYDDTLYLADLKTLLAVLANCPQANDKVLLIGHNPGLEQLLEYLCGGDLPLSENGKLLTTASLAEVSLPRSWRSLDAGVGQLKRLIRPAEIKSS